MTNFLKAMLTTAVVMFGLSSGANAQDDEMILKMKNAIRPAADMITGGQPAKEDFQVFKQEGVKTVISLRGENESIPFDEAAEAKKNGMNFVNIPIESADDLTLENAKKLSGVLGDVKDGKAVLHCGSGNRVGALMAVKAYALDGKSEAEAMAIGQEYGMGSLADALPAILAKMPTEKLMSKMPKMPKLPKLPN